MNKLRETLYSKHFNEITKSTEIRRYRVSCVECRYIH